ncbi:hypothetical protein Poly30_04860 [Planctomycetes bacterium Poly30]|uniref:Flagellar FliJ protein n=1 Tax=Saltatorellus ferox TaxID=2528018 RepID=A0A518ELR2_9BACT|nr:hypothetical protein Poly30_04860 [Planctomycetes bacterium Poly30]
MSSFRLARLLALREQQAKAEKIRWAQAERAARDAAEQRQAGRERVALARQELVRNQVPGEGAPGPSVHATLAAYDALDGLTARTVSDDTALVQARARAEEARKPYDVRRRDVEALKRLEQRWLNEERRQRRRKENREREAFINGRRPTESPELTASQDHSTETAP